MKVLKKDNIFFMYVVVCCVMLCSCTKQEKELEISNHIIEKAAESNIISEEEKELAEKIEKGYDLPIDDKEKEEAEIECNMIMGILKDIYIKADKGDATNAIISDETIQQMVKMIGKKGYTVHTIRTYSNMENYGQAEEFLNNSLNGEKGTVVIYTVHSDGGIGREKYIFDGENMYVLAAKYSWENQNEPVLTYISYTRLKEWRYTDKGWFCYELCVPEYPEVTEMVDGSCLIRIQPITEKNKELSEKCVLGLGYQGQNLLCSNWNVENMSELDYNGMFEYLYGMKYGEKFNSEDYPNGIPKEEFESLIMEYIPVTGEQIKKYAAFDEENQTYYWERLGCFNYAPTFFGTSVPEVVDMKENDDGTVTLTVDAVCEMVICDDAVITHELTVRFAEDGSFRYLGNEILNDGIEEIPAYQYRIRKE